MRGAVSGHPMGGRFSLLPSSIVLLMLFSLFAPLVQFEGAAELRDESLRLDSPKSGTLVDVPSWRIGDTWDHDAYFDVADLIASSGVSANVQTLTGSLSMWVDSITTETVENRSTLVYTLRSSGSFGANGVSLDGNNGDLDVDYESTELYRVSDLALISRSMDLEVDFTVFGFINIDIADLTILTTYVPPQERYDFPLIVGESHNSNYTSSVYWSGDSDYIDPLPEDTITETSSAYTVVSTGNPGVPYTGCGNSYNVTQFDTNGTPDGWNWFCPAVNFDAWQHIEAEGLVIDFKLTAFSPASRSRLVTIDLQYPAYFLDYPIGAWVNVTSAGGTPMLGEDVEFRYESESDIRTVTTASNGSAYVEFDTGHTLDPSYTTYDYASHGAIGWISSSNQIGVSTMTLDDDLTEVDLLTTANGVTVERIRDGLSTILTTATGYSAVPGDQLTFSVPVRNIGLLDSPATQFEATSPDGTTSRVNVPVLAPLAEVRVDVSWTVPTTQAIGDVSLDFEVDPDGAVLQDENRDNNADSLSLFIGRLPSAVLSNIAPALTYDTVFIDAVQSYDEDGGDILCIFDVESADGSIAHYETSTCQLEWFWTDDGTYAVDLEVIDDEGDSVSTSMDIHILNRPAVVVLASSANSVKVGESVTFNAGDNSDIDTNTPEAPISMLWDPPNDPDGVPYVCAEGLVTQLCTVVPEDEGQFTMTFRALDDDGALTLVTHSITVTNIAPHDGSIDLREAGEGEMMEIDSQQVWNVDEDQSLELVGHVTDSPNDMDTLRWEWQPDIDVDPSWHEVNEGPMSVLPVSWSESGLHVIAMQVFDDDEESSGVVSGWVRVHNVAPTIEPFEQPLPLWEDAEALFTATYGDTASDADALIACWDLDPYIDSDNEGSADDDCDIGGATLSHTWTEAGIYRVIFHVTDDDGDIATEAVNFTVRNRKPVAGIWASNLEPTVGEMFSLSGNTSSDTPSDLEALIYRWDLDTSVDSDDDGFADNDIDATGMEIWIKIEDPGSRGIRLMVSDEGETATMDITIIAQAEEGDVLGFLSFEGGGVTLIVIILALVLMTLLGVLALTSKRGRDSADPWDQSSGILPISGEPIEAPMEAPMEAPTSSMFEAPPVEMPPTPVEAAPVEAAPVQQAPPIPAEGLPPGWTEEQWTHFGAQWLEQEGAKAPEIAPQVSAPPEDDLDLDL